jgi:hypothetical protein|tara:strand:+ start:1890 stop:2408 length:519 start_codon:yes stop_codon:yes gene_type:complete
MGTEEGLKSKIDKIMERFEEMDKNPPKKEKKFKLPLGKRMGGTAKVKKGYALVILLRTNGSTLMNFFPIRDDLVYISDVDTYHISSTDFIGYYKKYPLIILPEWDLQPLRRHKLYKEAIEHERLAKPQRAIIQAIHAAQLKQKSAFGGTGLLWLIIGGIAVLYIIYAGITGQ